MRKYLTSPVATDRMPKGVPYIIGNEAAERFSYYGMRTVLTVFMTQHLLTSSGEPNNMGEEQASSIFHLFLGASYFFPILGALIADIFWGKYKTILFLSLGYCLGHGFLALGDTGLGTGLAEPRTWLYLGLIFIAVGAGGIKPCVSAHVGDQFGAKNRALISRVFGFFYLSINVGAMASTLLTPVLLERYGPWAAFGLPGALMAIATFVFWLGRNKFVHVPPSGWTEFKKETFGPEGRAAIRNLAPVFLIFIPMFWALYDQTGSAWVLQAVDMDRHFLGFTWLESQIQAVNPFLIIVFVPLFSFVVYPFFGRMFKLTPLRKMGAGFFLTGVAFSISALIESSISAGNTPNVGWQFLAYVVLTAAEVLVSITGLEFAYTQSPRRMKSFIMGIYLLGVSLGNFFTSGVNLVIQNEDGTSKLEGASYYWFFTILMLVTAVIFVFYSKRYRGRTYMQGEDENTPFSEAVERPG